MNNLLDTWNIHQKMNELLLGAIKETELTNASVIKGRSVHEHFCHIHNVRLMWFKAALPDLLVGLVKLEKEKQVSKKDIFSELQKSGSAMVRLLESGFSTGRIKGFKPHPEAFLGYLISHESHHRGQVISILKENGHLPDKKILYGLWEWGTRI